MQDYTPEGLRAYAERNGITWKGSVRNDGDWWRAKLAFSDGQFGHEAPGRTKDEAIAYVIEVAITMRDNPPEQPDRGMSMMDWS